MKPVIQQLEFAWSRTGSILRSGPNDSARFREQIPQVMFRFQNDL
jgi:hypothetical protein